MKLRKKDYIIFYVVIVSSYLMQLMSLKVGIIFAIVIVGIVPALILGTITNFLFRKK